MQFLQNFSFFFFILLRNVLIEIERSNDKIHFRLNQPRKFLITLKTKNVVLDHGRGQLVKF